MYKVIIEEDCSCFRNSDLKSHNVFDNEDNAYDFAINMKNRMNGEFCSKHSFQVLKIFDNFRIALAKPLEKSFKCCGSGCCK
ncbi:hypothetical protein AVENP_0642 [Arcobacter venerupis]|uniref:Uncharacterized protein n=1 Tax=Arcobacter venerupis TaxID=1054033 RepID=A0AAE7B6G0_9BACT|nr:hypothetical protein [Arcobacter venerupis]QKF66213.1 hypothetical protein AVENP_0642 [Arcobacter venerupis]RWS51001.1 hypothetical protein CKA56_01330 [Arcobacter venerupis]